MYREIFKENSPQNSEGNLFQRKKVFLLIIILIFFSKYFFSQNYNIDYYGVVSTEIDSNMAKMTGDLYYTQLNEINNFTHFKISS